MKDQISQLINAETKPAVKRIISRIKTMPTEFDKAISGKSDFDFLIFSEFLTNNF
jgi:hypothetical protein